MTTPENNADRFAIVQVGDRDVRLKFISNGQLTMLGLLGNRAMSEATPPMERMKSAGSMQAILLSMVVDPADREFVENEVIEGRLDLEAMAGWVRAFGEGVAPAKPKVTRGRPAKR